MIKLEEIQSLITPDTSVFWFRRDLRMNDNAGLCHALKNEKNVLPVFVFDTAILDELEDRHDRRVEFIHSSIQQMKEALEKVNSSLLVWHGDPAELFKAIQPKAVYCNHDYEPSSIARDTRIKSILEAKGSAFLSFKDQVIFEKEEVIKEDGSPYTVFTPYSKKWKTRLKAFNLPHYPSETHFANLRKLIPLPFPALTEIGFNETGTSRPDRKIKTKIIEGYGRTRDYPGKSGTTRLSVHLRFGTISIRKLVALAVQKSDSLLNELIWREFYQSILWHFPCVEYQAFKAKYDFVPWNNDETEFQLWCSGKTGYPIVDAGMRELNSTGFMHNRVRMITASFLTKHLLIDWRWGEAYFAKKLLDYDLAANNGGWQWAAGCGCDAAPYFRMFNPRLQTEKFDPDRRYIRKWVPEFGTPDYPEPIVNHEFARGRLLSTFKKALQE